MLKMIRYRFRLYRLIKAGCLFCWQNVADPTDLVGLSHTPDDARDWARSHAAAPHVGSYAA